MGDQPQELIGLPKWRTNPRKPAWVAPYITSRDVEAAKACWKGEGTPEHQRHILEWIINEGGLYGEVSFRSDKDGGERETAFAQGRWFVAQQLQKLIGLDERRVAKLREMDSGGSREPGSTTSKHDRSGS